MRAARPPAAPLPPAQLHTGPPPPQGPLPPLPANLVIFNCSANRLNGSLPRNSFDVLRFLGEPGPAGVLGNNGFGMWVSANMLAGTRSCASQFTRRVATASKRAKRVHTAQAPFLGIRNPNRLTFCRPGPLALLQTSHRITSQVRFGVV